MVLSCKNVGIQGNFNSISVGCNYLGTKLTLNNLYINSTYLNLLSFVLVVSNVTNPSLANTYTPVTTLEIHDASSALIDAGSSTQTVTISPLAAICSVSVLNGIVFSRGQLSISYSSSMVSGSSNSSYNLSVTVPNFYS